MPEYQSLQAVFGEHFLQIVLKILLEMKSDILPGEYEYYILLSL